MAMSMPSDMDMGTDHSEGMTAPTAAVPTLRYSMPMSAQVQMAKKRFDYETNPESSSTGMPDHSKNILSCAHEPCSQVWASVSPPSRGHTRLIALHSIANNISNVPNVCIGSHSIRLATHPPNLPAVDLATTLRI